MAWEAIIMSTPRDRGYKRWLAAAVGAVALTALPQTARADEAIGKVTWVDQKNNALLLECIDKGCAKIPSAKTGENFTFVIPSGLKSKVTALKEGQQVTVSYKATKSGAYELVSVK